jgi:hypothetical protein
MFKNILILNIHILSKTVHLAYIVQYWKFIVIVAVGCLKGATASNGPTVRPQMMHE